MTYRTYAAFASFEENVYDGVGFSRHRLIGGAIALDKKIGFQHGGCPMRTVLGTDWVLDVERGPEWLIVHLAEHSRRRWAADATCLAEQLWQLCQQHFTWRLIVDLERLPLLTSAVLGQFILLHELVHQRGGILRLCGVSPTQADTLRLSRLETKLPLYQSARDAVLGFCRPKPK